MISPSAVRRFMERKLRDLNRVKRSPLHRLKYLLGQEGFWSDSPDALWLQQAASIFCGIRLKWFMALLPVGTGKARIGLELCQYRLRKKHTKHVLYVTLNDQACTELQAGAEEHAPELSVIVLEGTTLERWQCRAEAAEQTTSTRL